MKRGSKLLFSMTVSNLVKIRAITALGFLRKVSFTIFVVTKSEFQRRVPNIFEFTLSFFQALFKRWINNKLVPCQIYIVNKQRYSPLTWNNPFSKKKPYVNQKYWWLENMWMKRQKKKIHFGCWGSLCLSLFLSPTWLSVANFWLFWSGQPH